MLSADRQHRIFSWNERLWKCIFGVIDLSLWTRARAAPIYIWYRLYSCCAWIVVLKCHKTRNRLRWTAKTNTTNGAPNRMKIIQKIYDSHSNDDTAIENFENEKQKHSVVGVALLFCLFCLIHLRCKDEKLPFNWSYLNVHHDMFVFMHEEKKKSDLTYFSLSIIKLLCAFFFSSFLPPRDLFLFSFHFDTFYTFNELVHTNECVCVCERERKKRKTKKICKLTEK